MMMCRKTLVDVALALLALDADHAWWVTEETHTCEDCGAPAEAPGFACNHAPTCRVAPVLVAVDAHRAAVRASVAWEREQGREQERAAANGGVR